MRSSGSLNIKIFLRSLHTLMVASTQQNPTSWQLSITSKHAKNGPWRKVQSDLPRLKNPRLYLIEGGLMMTKGLR